MDACRSVIPFVANALRYELEQQQLLERREAGVISQQQHDLFIEQAELQHQQNLQAIRDTAAQKEMALRNNLARRKKAAAIAAQKVEQNTLVAEVNFAQQIFGQLLSGAAQHNKQAFEIDKASRMATAAINAHTAASQALAAYPPPFNAVAAPAAYALGLVRVNAIRQQKFKGGASGGSGGGGSVSVPTGGGAQAPATSPPALPPTAASEPQNEAVEESTGPSKVTIELVGERYSREQVRELLEQLGEEAQVQVDVGTGEGNSGVAA